MHAVTCSNNPASGKIYFGAKTTRLAFGLQRTSPEVWKAGYPLEKLTREDLQLIDNIVNGKVESKEQTLVLGESYLPDLREIIQKAGPRPWAFTPVHTHLNFGLPIGRSKMVKSPS